jgi:hypothetical protein
MIKTTTTTFVNIKATTWTHESKDLFDFESSQFLEKSLEAHASASLLRVNDDIQTVDNQNGSIENQENLLSLKKDNETFSLCRASQNMDDSASKCEQPWLVVKSVNPSNIHYKGHTLTEGDIIKLGKIKLRIRELHPFGNLEDSLESPIEETKTEETCPQFIQKQQVESLPDGQEFTCKICLETEYNLANPLITPCSCSGSVKHVHLSCLKQWITSKCYSKVDVACSMYMWKDLECELCHQSLPDVFLHDNQEISLVDIVKPKTPYLILETMPENKDIRKVYYVATVTEDNKECLLKLGRKSDCHVKINDISVSRLHAMIKLHNGKFLLENGFSKFGTLLLLRGEVPLHKEYGTSVQIGRTVLAFDLATKEEIQIVPEPLPQEPVVVDEKVYNSPLSVNSDDKVQRRLSDDIFSTGIENYKTNTSSFYNVPNDDRITTDLNASIRKWSIGSYNESQIQKDIKQIDDMLASMKEMIIETSNQVNDKFVHLLEAKSLYSTGDNNFSPIKTFKEQEESASSPHKINEF